MPADKRSDVFADLIDANEAAAILGISPENLRVRVHRKQIPPSAMFRGAGLVAYHRSEIQRLAADPDPSPSLLRAREALRKKVERTLQDLEEIRERVDSTMNVNGLTREALRIVERAARQLGKAK